MLLEIKRLSKSFLQPQGQVLSVISDLDFSIGNGERVAIVGPSGSGKTTFLHLIAGLDRPDSGEVFFNKEPLLLKDKNKIALFRRKHIGLIFQFYHLLSELTVLENVMLPLLFNKVGFSVARERAFSLLKKVGLDDKADSSVESLSGGQMQRVAILRAIVHRPSLLLADEPTGNLDPATQQLVLRFLLELSSDYKMAIICVTHSNEIASCFDKVYLLKNGRLVAC